MFFKGSLGLERGKRKRERRGAYRLPPKLAKPIVIVGFS